MSTHPVLVEVYRGQAVESQHRGSVAVIDADGKTVLELGDIETPVFPRSAVKAFQALPLVESGIADRFGLTDEELALAISSHSGEQRHAETALRILNKAGRDQTCLECGAHWPSDKIAERALAASGQNPSALHNNCSGKHSGFICLACGLDEDPKGYIKPEHRVQKEIRAAGEEITGFRVREEWTGTDGCSIPTYAMPLKNLAHGFAKLGTGTGLAPERAKAAARLRRAAAAHPFMVAGTGRLDTVAMEIFGARLFMKTGAEGVYCAALPEQGLGIALKADDGETRASQAMLAGIVHRFLRMSEEERRAFNAKAWPTLTNWNGMAVGSVKPTSLLTGA
ncbi:MAG: asparaginase [Hyphomicrobiales bacterium]